MGAWVLVFFLHGEPYAAVIQPSSEACEKVVAALEKSSLGARCFPRDLPAEESGYNPDKPYVQGGNA